MFKRLKVHGTLTFQSSQFRNLERKIQLGPKAQNFSFRFSLRYRRLKTELSSFSLSSSSTAVVGLAGVVGFIRLEDDLVVAVAVVLL